MSASLEPLLLSPSRRQLVAVITNDESRPTLVQVTRARRTTSTQNPASGSMRREASVDVGTAIISFLSLAGLQKLELQV